MTFPRLPFEAVFADESGGNIKTPQSEYCREGAFPIVDQGKALIAGYTNDRDRLCGQGRPAIVFGDHTRAVKHIDFPFCMGADGVKVLRPKVEADLKYLSYYLKSLDLASAGYDRHFKYLKRVDVIFPPVPEQRRIAAILDQADALRAKRRQALAELDSLAQSIFSEMFGDSAQNPRGWPTVAVGDVCERITVGVVVQPAAYYKPDGVPALRSLNVRANRVARDEFVYISKSDNEGPLAKSRVWAGDVLLVRSGRPGTSAIVPQALDGVNAVDILITTPDKNAVLPEYLCRFFNSSAGRAIVLGEQRGQIQKHLNVGSLREVTMPLPPLQLQAEWAKRLSRIEALRSSHASALSELDDLFSSLQHRAFAGQLS